MTMQGISNVLPKAAAAVAEKSEKAKGTLFEAVMSSQGNKQQTKKTMDGFVPDDRVDNRMAKKRVSGKPLSEIKSYQYKIRHSGFKRYAGFADSKSDGG